jgi:NAD(P)-dependent dehydrogenase (short-subunit alcohol dehydrogenase family)
VTKTTAIAAGYRSSMTNRSVFLTGGAGGLGTAVVQAFLDTGWRVVAPIRPGSNGKLPDAAIAVDADLSAPADVQAAMSVAAGDAAAPLRAVVNLVGAYGGGKLVHETPVEDFEAQLKLNLRPTYLACHAALPHLQAAGGGAIVCVSSRAALKPFAGAAGYIVAKAAVLAFVDVLATEYRDDHIRANAILPSVIDTPANRSAMPDADHGRWVAPEQIASVVRLLCEDASAIVSGAHVPVYGSA